MVSFSELLYQIDKFTHTEDIASKYIENANDFLQKVKTFGKTETAVLNQKVV